MHCQKVLVDPSRIVPASSVRLECHTRDINSSNVLSESAGGVQHVQYVVHNHFKKHKTKHKEH